MLMPVIDGGAVFSLKDGFIRVGASNFNDDTNR